MKYDIFVSYSRKDFKEVSAFKQLLEERLPGLNCWFDINGIESGDEFDEKIVTAIDNSQFVLFSLSDNSIQSNWSRMEVMYAKNTDKRVIPVLLKGAQLKGWFLFQFGRVDCIDSTVDLQVEKLIRNLSEWLNITSNTTPKKTSSAQTSTNEPEFSAEKMFEIGKAANDRQDYDEAVKWFRKAAEQGNAWAQAYLGEYYYYGQSVTEDNVEAVKWFRKAAEQGNAWAQAHLGECYYYGYGVTEDNVEAVKWYRKAAEQGDAWSQYNLGYCYENAQGVAEDYGEAVKWYRKSAEQGNASAQFNLGGCYEEGLGVTEDSEEAGRWYRMAAEQGHPEAQCVVGIIYENKQDYDEAVKWFRKSAEQGDSGGQYSLAHCYDEGLGVIQNYDEAVKWYRKAAEQGHGSATSRLEELTK